MLPSLMGLQIARGERLALAVHGTEQPFVPLWINERRDLTSDVGGNKMPLQSPDRVKQTGNCQHPLVPVRLYLVCTQHIFVDG